jgi:hypothetical protein
MSGHSSRSESMSSKPSHGWGGKDTYLILVGSAAEPIVFLMFPRGIIPIFGSCRQLMPVGDKLRHHSQGR